MTVSSTQTPLDRSGHLVNLHVAGDVAGARQEAGVMLAGRVELAGHGRNVVELQDFQGRADGQPLAVAGQAHRLVEAAEVRIDDAPVGPQHHQLAGLVGRHQQGNAQVGRPQFIALDVEVGGMSTEELLAAQCTWSAGVTQVCPSRQAVLFVLGWR